MAATNSSKDPIETIESLIAAGTTFDSEQLDLIYHDDRWQVIREVVFAQPAA